MNKGQTALVPSLDDRLVEVSLEVKRKLVERIVISPSFSKSERLSSFLLHICTLDQQGRLNEISEQQIGEAVFGRPQNYDPSIDGIVRSHASRLRLRLDQYFTQEGVNEPIRLHIPRGAYVPFYAPRPHDKLAQEDTPTFSRLPHPRPLSDTPPRRLLYRIAAFCLLLLTVSVLSFEFARSKFPVIERLLSAVDPSPTDKLWQALFQPGRETLFVVGDGGANMFENMATRQLTTEEYSSRSWLKEPLAQTPSGFSWAPIATRNYTPYFSVDLAVKLARLPQVSDGQLTTMFARDLRLDNLKDSQAILIGGPNYNPWEQLFSRDQNFRMIYDAVENSISIVNLHPQSGEPAIFQWRQTDTKSHYGYSLITLSKNLNHNGHVLILQGATAQGDKAAADFLLARKEIEPFLRKALGQNGQLEDFEIVLETSFVAGGNTDTHVVGFRIHHSG
ncbi:hypothetical protein [Granulicella arctica]|uniref:Uncharacterized protein n=1 Tax=Granulicella arctica TaxID=940613 RepID=A0A7Y9PFE5_9BACT|nr:hypothetical protein [Granulicella arctica]NYF78168.1 hypothetical protein [Granulicella arctica]